MTQSKNRKVQSANVTSQATIDNAIAVGIDGCKGGWFFFRIEHGKVTFGASSRISPILSSVPSTARVLIDIPIGLKESGTKERECDLEARDLLRPKRHASVFPTPCRQALLESNYDSANKTNRLITGRGLSRQSWGIAPKIIEVDQYLEALEEVAPKVFEAHPELVFYGLAGRRPMAASKKTREGFLERLEVLKAWESNAETSIAKAFLRHGGFDALRDDIVDAYALALCANRPDLWRQIPEEPEQDARGLPMRMTYALSPTMCDAPPLQDSRRCRASCSTLATEERGH